MKKITRKADIQESIKACQTAYHADGLTACVAELHKKLLENKVKFPLLEYTALLLADFLPEEEQIPCCDQVASLRTIGGNVIVGILLQQRLDLLFLQSLCKAAGYIQEGGQWYVCDIIGERVFGFALLHHPEKALSEIKKLSAHPSHWVVRSLGAGAHYAIKKGLGKEQVKKIFALLLAMSDTQNKEVRQGVGWAAKTTAKFHPDIIEAYGAQIRDTAKVPNWFRSKIKTGLARHQYAKGD